MKFLVDMNIGKSIEQFLINQGYDVSCIRDINPRMSDLEIINHAKEENRIIITMDHDFGQLVFQQDKSHTGIIVLDIHDKTIDERKEIISGIIKQLGTQLETKFVVYRNNRLRIK